MSRVTVKDLIGIQPRELPAALSGLPVILRQVQSRSLRNAADLSTYGSTPRQAQTDSYRILRERVLAHAKQVDDETHSVVTQIIATVEHQGQEHAGRITILGTILSRLEDKEFLVSLRDTLAA